MQDRTEPPHGTTEVQYQHKVAIRATLATMSAEQRAAKLRQLHDAVITAPDDEQRARLRSIASTVATINRELQMQPYAPQRERVQVVTPDLAKGIVGLAAIGGGVYAVYHITALAVGSGLLPYIGGGAALLFVLSAFGSGKEEYRPEKPGKKITITQTQTTTIEQ
jgi:hypothetical protein